MLIIGNDCSSAQVYKKLKMEYNNPFTWCRILYGDFKKLILNWGNINLDNITKIDNFTSHPILKKQYTDTNRKYFLEIDNQIILGFSHYLQDNRNHKDKWRTYSTDVKSFIVKKYKERLERFKQIDEEPVFIFNEKKYTNLSQLIDFARLDVPYKKFIYTSHKELLDYANDNTIVFLDTNIDYGEAYKYFADKIIENLNISN